MALLLHHARDRRVLNTEGELAGVGKTPGIDVRGDGGYIIVAPSIRPAPPRSAKARGWAATSGPTALTGWPKHPSGSRSPNGRRNLLKPVFPPPDPGCHRRDGTCRLERKRRSMGKSGECNTPAKETATRPCSMLPPTCSRSSTPVSQQGTGPRRVDHRRAVRRPGRTGDPPNPRRPMATQGWRAARRLGATATALCHHKPKLVTSHPALSSRGCWRHLYLVTDRRVSAALIDDLCIATAWGCPFPAKAMSEGTT